MPGKISATFARTGRLLPAQDLVEMQEGAGQMKLRWRNLHGPNVSRGAIQFNLLSQPAVGRPMGVPTDRDGAIVAWRPKTPLGHDARPRSARSASGRRASGWPAGVH